MRGRSKGLLRGILSGGVWNGFLLERVRADVVPCRFCIEADWDGYLFLGVLLPLLGPNS